MNSKKIIEKNMEKIKLDLIFTNKLIFNYIRFVVAPNLKYDIYKAIGLALLTG